MDQVFWNLTAEQWLAIGISLAIFLGFFSWVGGLSPF